MTKDCRARNPSRNQITQCTNVLAENVTSYTRKKFVFNIFVNFKPVFLFENRTGVIRQSRKQFMHHVLPHLTNVPVG